MGGRRSNPAPPPPPPPAPPPPAPRSPEVSTMRARRDRSDEQLRRGGRGANILAGALGSGDGSTATGTKTLLG